MIMIGEFEMNIHLIQECIDDKWKPLTEADYNLHVEEPLCPLCQYHECVTCPIYEDSHAVACDNTPYYPWANAKRTAEIGNIPPEEAQAAAYDELAYLYDLQAKLYRRLEKEYLACGTQY